MSHKMAHNVLVLPKAGKSKHESSLELLLLNLDKCFIEALQPPYCQTDVCALLRYINDEREPRPLTAGDGHWL